MINIITIICHLTPNETLNEPQHSNFLELMYLLEALKHPLLFSLQEEYAHVVINHQHKVGTHGPSSPLGFSCNYCAIFPGVSFFALQLKTS